MADTPAGHRLREALLGLDCDAGHASEAARLQRIVKGRDGFRLVILQFNDHPYRDRLLGRIEHLLAADPARLDTRQYADFEVFEQALAAAAADHDLVQVTGLETWLAGEAGKLRLHGFNYHREALAEACRVPLLLWMPEPYVRAFATEAPDLWAWRTGLLDFSRTAKPPVPAATPPEPSGIDALDLGQAQARYREISQYLEASNEIAGGTRAALLREQAKLLVRLGDPETALERLAEARKEANSVRDTRRSAAADLDTAVIISMQGRLDDALRLLRETVLPAFEQLGDLHSKAVTQGQIAGILQARGELNEALQVYREDVLPAFERLGDLREKAVTQGQIADIFHDRGELDEALLVYRRDVLPAFERLGDLREKALTQGRIADILQARGELDEALRIRTEEQLPIYDRLGDVRSKAVAQGKIADILQARGELDAALRTRTEEQLPVFDRLGDAREKAVTYGRIADTLQARGELDEAFRIHTEEELPVYERLGDVYASAVTQGKIADILQARGELTDALRIRTEEELPVYERLGDVRAKAVTQGKIADILQARGELDEALRIRIDEELPVYERLGDVRGLLVARTETALNLLARQAPGDRQAAHDYLCTALAAALKLRIPEAAQIFAFLLHHRMRCETIPEETWERLARQLEGGPV